MNEKKELKEGMNNWIMREEKRKEKRREGMKKKYEKKDREKASLTKTTEQVLGSAHYLVFPNRTSKSGFCFAFPECFP